MKDERNEIIKRINEWADLSDDHITLTILANTRTGKVSSGISGNEPELANVLFSVMLESPLMEKVVKMVASHFDEEKLKVMQRRRTKADC